MVRKRRLKGLQNSLHPNTARLIRPIVGRRNVLEKPEDLEKMGTKTLNERQAFDTTRSHLEKAKRLHGKSFDVSDIPQSLLDEGNRILTEIRPINLGDRDRSLESDGHMEEKEGEGAESDAISV